MSVYTTIETAELEEFLSHYDVGALLSFEGISDGIENTNYFVDTQNGPKKSPRKSQFVLTLFEHHDFDEMRYYLDLMHHLADHEVPSANPVADRDGKYLRLFKNKPAALVERLNGKSIIDTNVNHCKQIGAAMGKMHSAGLSFNAHQKNPRGPGWYKSTAGVLHCKLPANESKLLNAELEFQYSKRNADLPRGVIHADLFRDNTLWDGDKLSGIIDFYYACDDALLYDLAITANDWCSNDDFSLDAERVHALLNSYHQYRPLDDKEQEYWPTMLRAAALRFWLSRLYDMHFPRSGELTHTKNPDAFKAIINDRIQHHDSYRSCWI